MVTLFEILYEDADLLVLRKPAGLVCHPTKGDEFSSLVSRVRIHLGFEPHMIHRLDRETGGVMVFAKTDEAGAELRSANQTIAPSAAKARTVASPMPAAPPVISTTRFWSSRFMGKIQQRWNQTKTRKRFSAPCAGNGPF